MSDVIEQIQQPQIYGYWESWLGSLDTGAKLIIVPRLGNVPNTDIYIPVIRPFTTFRVSLITQAVAAAATNWIVTLWKNGGAAAFANGYNFGAAPGTAIRTQLWVDIGGVQAPVSFVRSDTWGITLAGATVTDPKTTVVMDMFGMWQIVGGPSTRWLKSVTSNRSSLRRLLRQGAWRRHRRRARSSSSRSRHTCVGCSTHSASIFRRSRTGSQR